MQCTLCDQPTSATDRRCPLCGEEIEVSGDASTVSLIEIPPETTAPAGAVIDLDETELIYAPFPALAPVVLSTESMPASQADPQPRGRRSRLGPVAVALAVGLGLGGLWYSSRDDTGLTSSGGSPSTGSPSVVSPSSNDSSDLDTDGGTPTDEDPSSDEPDDESIDPGSPTDLTGMTQVSAGATSADGRDASDAVISYGAENLTDGSAVTAWRMDGDGSGTSILVTFPHPVSITAVALTNGYTKRDPVSGSNRYAEERRITKVTWTMDDGTGISQTLIDEQWGLQRLDVPSITTSALTLTIDETTAPGDPERDYTAISEISLTGTDSAS